MDELDNDLLPTDVLRDVLGDEIGDHFKVDHVDYRNSEVKYEVLAGANLGAKKEMSQFLPILIQMFTNPIFLQGIKDAGYKFDALAIFQSFCDAAGWKFSQNFVVPMTDQEKQKEQANSPAALQAQQAQAAQKMQQQKFQQEQILENQKQLGKAGNEAVRASIEKSTSPEYLGTNNTEGFGSTTAL